MSFDVLYYMKLIRATDIQTLHYSTLLNREDDKYTPKDLFAVYRDEVKPDSNLHYISYRYVDPTTNEPIINQSGSFRCEHAYFTSNEFIKITNPKFQNFQPITKVPL